MIALTAPNLLTLLDKVTGSWALVIGHNQVDSSAKHLGEGTQEIASYEVQPTRVFFPQFCPLGGLGNHPHEEWAKFGKRLVKRVETFWNQNSKAIPNCFYLKIWWLLCIVFTKSLCSIGNRSLLLGWHSARIPPKTKHCSQPCAKMR